jgi:hypothetical protein
MNHPKQFVIGPGFQAFAGEGHPFVSTISVAAVASPAELEIASRTENSSFALRMGPVCAGKQDPQRAGTNHTSTAAETHWASKHSLLESVWRDDWLLPKVEIHALCRRLYTAALHAGWHNRGSCDLLQVIGYLNPGLTGRLLII